ncbi:hypothetical protein BD626DRAFT_635792 [Schizophyllum amplum]|uniref:Uncharacterized protein n=1 Tax=Schizophyllum amplum TaxID=97359 RepID=A0A550BVH2_9AGAR|nr:hypothetical protein BD626DRAFT_635792 [Auriculariopsis ampla]
MIASVVFVTVVVFVHAVVVFVHAVVVFVHAVVVFVVAVVVFVVPVVVFFVVAVVVFVVALVVFLVAVVVFLVPVVVVSIFFSALTFMQTFGWDITGGALVPSLDVFEESLLDVFEKFSLETFEGKSSSLSGATPTAQHVDRRLEPGAITSGISACMRLDQIAMMPFAAMMPTKARRVGRRWEAGGQATLSGKPYVPQRRTLRPSMTRPTSLNSELYVPQRQAFEGHRDPVSDTIVIRLSGFEEDGAERSQEDGQRYPEDGGWAAEWMTNRSRRMGNRRREEQDGDREDTSHTSRFRRLATPRVLPAACGTGPHLSPAEDKVVDRTVR